MTYYSTNTNNLTGVPVMLEASATASSQDALVKALYDQAAAFFGTEQDIYQDGVIVCTPDIEEGSFSTGSRTTVWRGSAVFVNEAATNDRTQSTKVVTVTTDGLGTSRWG